MRYLLLLLILLPWNAGGIPKEEIIMASLLLNEGQEQVREDLIVLKENGTFQQTKTVWAYLLEPPRWYLLLPGDRPFSRLIVLHEFWHYLQGDRESLFPLEIEADLYAFEGAEEEECFIFYKYLKKETLLLLSPFERALVHGGYAEAVAGASHPTLESRLFMCLDWAY